VSLKTAAAKQDAFEEANKLKNQFRSLDEDEIEFLDSVMESTRREEDKVKKETKESLEAFRRQQELADKKLGRDLDNTEVSEEQWAASHRKRKRAKEKEGLRGVKLRKSSSTNEQPGVAAPSPNSKSSTESTLDSLKIAPSPSTALVPTKAVAAQTANKVQTEIKPEIALHKKPASVPSSKGLALVAYGSDDDDD